MTSILEFLSFIFVNLQLKSQKIFEFFLVNVQRYSRGISHQFSDLNVGNDLRILPPLSQDFLFTF